MPVEFRTGRPPHWNNCLDLAAQCEMYFEYCEENDKHPGIVGLSVFLDCDRHALYDYAKKPEFSHIIKKYKARVEAYLEERLQANASTGSIFNLKCNFGWRDVQTIEQSGPGGGPIKTQNEYKVTFVSSDGNEIVRSSR